MTPKQILFCEEYLKDFNATQAAIRAGYSKETAYSIGWENLRKPEIRNLIDGRLTELSLSAAETTKLICDIAKGNLNDYMVVKQVYQSPKIEVGLQHLIDKLLYQIEFEEEYASKVSLNDDELKQHKQSQESRRKEIIRYEIELSKNPLAKRIIDGEPELVDVAEIDMVKIAADKEKGRIKSITPGMYGNKIELYGADGALFNIAKMHGLYAKDNEQGKTTVNLQITKEQAKEISNAIDGDI